MINDTPPPSPPPLFAQSLKLQLERTQGIEVAHQFFTLNGRELKDAQTLAECGIRDGDLLHMLFPHGPWVRVMPLFGAEMQVSSRRVESSSNTCAHELLRQNWGERLVVGGAPLHGELVCGGPATLPGLWP